MKKLMWVAAMIPLEVTSIVLQFMPDVIPMHYDLEEKFPAFYAASCLSW